MLHDCTDAVYTLYGTGNQRHDLDEIFKVTRASKFTFVAAGVFTEETEEAE
jgi:hypothetical protein